MVQFVVVVEGFVFGDLYIDVWYQVVVLVGELVFDVEFECFEFVGEVDEVEVDVEFWFC